MLAFLDYRKRISPLVQLTFLAIVVAIIICDDDSFVAGSGGGCDCDSCTTRPVALTAVEHVVGTESLLECSLERAGFVKAVVVQECKVSEERYAMEVARRERSSAEFDECVATMIDRPSRCPETQCYDATSAIVTVSQCTLVLVERSNTSCRR
jgi:hypothetical protein